ncbi:hypothetical protein BGZ95_007518 [Linnemannia exigua]|uniref:Uncharacterized protein n=1 Tax=Linnemannia exigua TaxID=604196 RepID=A0AAD4DL24_9FUNG|nr:hypothetical protein BGZ95_007518 [Linnemannia exigua]
MAGEGSRPPFGVSQASRSFSAISATSVASGQPSSQVFGTNALTISGPNTRSIFGSASLSNPSSLSAISATSLGSEATGSQAFSAAASTISGSSSQSDPETISPAQRTSASQISATESVSSTGSPSQKQDTNAAAPASSRRESTELRYDLPGCRSRRSTREGEAGPRLTVTDIQKLLVIPKGLITQKDYGRSKAGSRIVPPPLKERNRNGKLANKTKTKMTVTELQKQFIIPKGLITQKQYGKKDQARTTNLFAKGSYAGRLVDLMHYHRSEYSMWANATIREVA